MKSTVLIGTFINSKSVAKAAVELAENHIDVVMAGFNKDFGIDDYLAAGDILYWIEKELNDSKDPKTKIDEYDGKVYWKELDGLSEYAKSAVIGSRDEELSKKYIKNCRSGKRLNYLGYSEDVEFCMKRNISTNVPIYKNGILELYKI